MSIPLTSSRSPTSTGSCQSWAPTRSNRFQAPIRLLEMASGTKLIQLFSFHRHHYVHDVLTWSRAVCAAPRSIRRLRVIRRVIASTHSTLGGKGVELAIAPRHKNAETLNGRLSIGWTFLSI